MAPLIIQEIEEDAIPQQSTSLALEPVEATLRDLLLDVAKYIQQASQHDEISSSITTPEELSKQEVILRFTGGWVRDKLLGVPSHDIDVAINNMTGYQFGMKLKEYLEIPGNLQKYGLDDIASSDAQSAKAGTTTKSKVVGGLHKIEANPEKSKHLETTTIRILGLDIDLVNLRKETYTDDSRNPQMEFGTPEEDALRRDATINAMFYNINTGEVEDFTGRGHEDMAKQLIRTPLEPYQTFLDDPLRVLRLIRFASRLDYQIVPETLAAMKREDIKAALQRKISRERVGTELEKALRGPHPHEALRLIFSLNLYDTVFCDPTQQPAQHVPHTENWSVLIDTSRDMISSGEILASLLMRDGDEEYLAWQLAALIPYRDAPVPVATELIRKPPPHIAVTVAREGIKTPNKVSDVVNAAVQHRDEIARLVDNIYQQKRRRQTTQNEGQEDYTARDTLGMALRRWGPTWRSQVMYALLVEVADMPENIETIERKYEIFVKELEQQDLLDVCSFKPLMDGKSLAKALATTPGPWMKDALEVVMAWQLRNPGIKDTTDAVEEVRKHRQNGELIHDLVRHFLKLTIRPFFAKTIPERVTSEGRKVTTTILPKKITAESMDDSMNRPWKSEKAAFVFDLLRWSTASLDQQLLTQVWPLIIPPILTLVDDWEAKYKTSGVQLLHTVLLTTPPTLLSRTGLGEVFEDALLPCLTFLPPITTAADSATLLTSVYPCLLTLANLRFPPSPSTPTSPQSLPLQDPARIAILDRHLRQAFLQPLSTTKQYPRIQTICLTNLPPLLHALGLDAVKHLKYLVPLLASILADHENAIVPDMLLAASQALREGIRVAWPRMMGWRVEVLRGLIECWSILDKVMDESVKGKLREELRDTVRVLRTAVKDRCEFDEEVNALVEADGRLKGLFEQA